MKDRKQTSGKTASAASNFGVEDVYFILFRRWKMLLFFFLVGVAAPFALMKFYPPPYYSEAKVLVRYVLDQRAPTVISPSSVVASPDSRGENIMNSEVEIFNSEDLAVAVVEEIGAERILAGTRNPTNKFAAIATVNKGKLIENPKRSNIIRVEFTHRDPEIAQLVVQKLIKAYLNKHQEIHRNSTVFDDVQRRQRETLRLAIEETERQLRTIRTNQVIISMDDKKRNIADRTTRLTEELSVSQSQLAESMALLNQTQGREAAAAGTTNAEPFAAELAAIPSEKVDSYRVLKTELDHFQKQERELLLVFTDAHPSVARVKGYLQARQAGVKELEKEFPVLARLPRGITNTAAPVVASPNGGLITIDPARIEALRAKIQSLTQSLAQVQKEALELVDAEIKINQLQRTRDLQEANFKYYQSSLDQAAVDEALGPGKVMNISTVQEPSMASIDMSKHKKLLMIAFGFPIAAGVGLAVLLEMFINQSIRRPSDVAAKTNAPLFVSLPYQPALLRAPSPAPRKLLANGTGGSPAGQGGTVLDTAVDLPPVLQPGNALAPYFETLRDRLVTFFDVNNMTHKPKLVGVTGCDRSSGVTTVAAALAASLSDSAEGKVLLVDMNQEGGAAQQFFKGKPAMGLNDLLDGGDSAKRSEALVQENLYVVSEREAGAGLPKLLHKRFLNLVPRLKLSDYDYIIFDLPEMGPTSVAPRVARFMDVVLLVAEAEKTHGNLLAQSTQILSEGGASVGVVLNRVRNYVPQSLSPNLG